MRHHKVNMPSWDMLMFAAMTEGQVLSQFPIDVGLLLNLRLNQRVELVIMNYWHRSSPRTQTERPHQTPTPGTRKSSRGRAEGGRVESHGRHQGQVDTRYLYCPWKNIACQTAMICGGFGRWPLLSQRGVWLPQSSGTHYLMPTLSTAFKLLGRPLFGAANLFVID